MIDKILEIGNRWYYTDQLSEDEIKLIRKEYRKHAGKTLQTCPSCYVKAYLFFINLKTKKMETKKSQFKLIAGKIIQMHGLPDVITKDNLTDAVALSALKTNPGAIKHFESYPENWREQADSFDPIKHMRENKKAHTNVAALNHDAGSSTENNDDEKRSNYESKELIELQEIATNFELPEEDWLKYKNTKKGKKEFVDYLMEKTK